MRIVVVSLVLTVAMLVGGCKKQPADNGLVTVDDYCPGQPHCLGKGDDQLHVGVSHQSIDPVLIETEWDDVDGDSRWDQGESFTDVNGNGVFDAIWIAGLGDSARPATGIHDEISVRALAVRWNDITVVIAYLDVIGYFVDDMERIKADPSVAALDVDHIIIGSTHNHAGPDTIGLWGRSQVETGRDEVYQQLTRDRTAAAIVEAVNTLQPAQMEVAQVLTVDANNSTLPYVGDARDPMILDPTMTLVRFAQATDANATIATMINWAAHPEYSGSRNTLLTSDYVHNLRATVEQGVGGTSVFVQGPLGGQIGPSDGVAPIDPVGGQPIPDDSLPKSDAAGINLGTLAVDALTNNAQPATDPAINYRTAEIYARVDNEALQFAITLGILDRQGYLYDETAQITEENTPYARTRSTYLQIGPVAMITAPGELHPELWLGGYDGSWSFGSDIITQTENTPDLSTAPAAPYLRDLMLGNEGVEYAFCAGLAEDFLGYIVAEFNFVLDEDDPYFSRADGHHYEETYALSPQVEEQIQHPMMDLAKWRAK